MGSFGEVLRWLRNKAGISQNELSKHIGVSKSSVNMYERGEREPSFETLEAIADYFNVDMDYLLGRSPFPGLEVVNMAVGQEIQKARKKAGLTQEELGAKLGVSGSMIAQYETGKCKPKYETLNRIAEALEVNVTAFIGPTEFAIQRTITIGIAFGHAFSNLENAKINGASLDEISRLEAECALLGAKYDISSGEYSLLLAFNKLNEKGQDIAVEQLQEIAKIPEYQRTPPTESTQNPSEGIDTTQDKESSEGA